MAVLIPSPNNYIMIATKRIYEAKSRGDGYRILVDRMWPRGIKKEEAAINEWLKDIAPSTELRKWFNHDAQLWDEFRKKYIHELEHNEALPRLKQLLKAHPTVTLLYSAKDELHNNAVALKTFIEHHG